VARERSCVSKPSAVRYCRPFRACKLLAGFRSRQTDVEDSVHGASTFLRLQQAVAAVAQQLRPCRQLHDDSSTFLRPGTARTGFVQFSGGTGRSCCCNGCYGLLQSKKVTPMHGVLYVCLPRSEARSSLQAGKGLQVPDGRGLRHATAVLWPRDYSVSASGYLGGLSLLRLRHERSKQFARFWKRYWMKTSVQKKRSGCLGRCFPNIKESCPSIGECRFRRECPMMLRYGRPLFQQTQAGFSTCGLLIRDHEPNVI